MGLDVGPIGANVLISLRFSCDSFWPQAQKRERKLSLVITITLIEAARVAPSLR